MKITPLKGGSLASTVLVEDNGKTFVRKQISLVKEREYGYYRWYSQLKKMQRVEKLFPRSCVKVLDYGLSTGPFSYMDLEYHQDAVNCYEYLCNTSHPAEVLNLFKKIMDKLNQLHFCQMPAHKNAMDLYFQEEIKNKIDECSVNEEFHAALHETDIPKSLCHLWNLAKDLYRDPVESYTHGNATLENILYLQDSNEILFIDLYEENIIDNKYADLSQLLQSCHANYESIVEFGENPPVPAGIKMFNTLVCDMINKRFKPREIDLIRFFECSQFYRMLPFKLKGSNSVDDVMPFLRVAEKLTKELLDG